MQHYNFDEIVDRWKTSCVKYDGMAEAYPGKEELTPLWVADMDFKTDTGLHHRCLESALRTSDIRLYLWG